MATPEESDMDEDIRDAVTDNCAFCGKPGGRIRIDPYAEDVNDEKVRVRLHDDCYGQLADEI